MEHKKHLHPKTNSCVLVWCVAPSRVPNSGKNIKYLTSSYKPILQATCWSLSWRSPTSPLKRSLNPSQKKKKTHTLGITTLLLSNNFLFSVGTCYHLDGRQGSYVWSRDLHVCSTQVIYCPRCNWPVGTIET